MQNDNNMNPWENNLFKSMMKFLQEHKTTEEEKKNKEHTHTGYGGYQGGSYKIVDKDEILFMNMYGEVIQEGIEMHLIERQKDVGPFLLDLDFNFELEDEYKKRQYNEEHVKITAQKVSEIFLKYHNLPKSQYELIITEKKDPSLKIDKNGEAQYYKDGFHIILPQPIRAEIRCAMTEDLKNLCIEEEWFSDIKFINDYDDLFDKSVSYRNGWMMYGSRKADGKMYKITKIYDGNMKEIELNTYSEDERVHLLSVRQYNNEDALNIRDEFNTEKEQDRIDKIAQIYSYREKKKDKPKLTEDRIKKIFNEDTPLSDSVMNRPYDNDTVSLAKKLVEILSSKRSDGYNDWIQLGWLLHNISDTLLDCWDKFSQKSRKYSEGVCEKEWKKMELKEDGLHIGTLKYWAAADNIAEFKKIMYSEVNEKMMDKEFGRHDDIALALKEMYGYFYSCASIKKNTWFEYQKNRWVSIQDGYTLNNKISDEFAQEILKLKTTVMLKAIEEGNTDNLDKRGREFASLAKNLKTTSFKNATMDACRNRFYDPEFEKKLNQNTGLIGFNNGVYDLRNRCFRAGCPDDYVTFSTGYEYDNRFNKDSPEVKEVQQFFDSLQMEKEVATYILVYIASILDGDAEDQNFIMWTGVGSNGKSTIMELLIATLGDYFGMVPITLLTQKRGSSSGATPELADKAGKRLLVMNETEHNDVIHIGYMKELTGGDLILARPLYGDPFYYKPQFHMLLLCNTLPNIPSTDKGTWRRIRAVPFPIEFVSGPCTKPNQKPRDKTLKTKMKNWNKPLIWLLLNVYYPMYKDTVKIEINDGRETEMKGLDAFEPKAVKDQTEKYKKDIDIHYEFFSSTYKKTGNDRDIIPFSVLFKQFKSWYNEYYDSRNPSKKDLESYFEKNDIKIHNGKIYGIKDINEDDDI